jgi:hypothetical protein
MAVLRTDQAEWPEVGSSVRPRIISNSTLAVRPLSTKGTGRVTLQRRGQSINPASFICNGPRY